MISRADIQYMPELDILDELDIQKIRHMISKYRDSGVLLTLLTQMAVQEGFSETEADRMAQQVMEWTTGFETLKKAVQEDPEKTVIWLIDRIHELEPQDRILILEQLYRNLCAASGDSSDLHLHPDAKDHERNPDRIRAYARYLEERIRMEVQHFSPSPAFLREIAEKLTGAEVTAGYEAAGESGFALKCVTAMYMSIHGERSGPEAIARNVMAACTTTGMEAVADAVARDLMIEDVAKNILAALLLTSMIFLAFSLIALGPAIMETGIKALSFSVLKAQIAKMGIMEWFIYGTGGFMYGTAAAVPLVALLDSLISTAGRGVEDICAGIRQMINKGSGFVILGLEKVADMNSEASELQKREYVPAAVDLVRNGRSRLEMSCSN